MTFEGLKCSSKNGMVQEFNLRNPSLVRHCLMAGSPGYCDTPSIVKDPSMDYYCTASNVTNTNFLTCMEKDGYFMCTCSFKETEHSYQTCFLYKAE